MAAGQRTLVGLGAGVAAAAAAGAAGLVTDRLTRDRRARETLSPPSAYACAADEERTVLASDGVALHVEIDEPAGGSDPARPTVILSHGFCLSLKSWVLQRRALSQAGYRVVLWDQRSHGRSGRGSRRSCDIDQLGRDLHRVIDQVAPDGPLVLIGHSMGGMTIMALADAFPDLVRDRVIATAFVSTSAGGAQLVSLGFGEVFGKLVSRLGPGVLDRLSRRRALLDGFRRWGRDVEDFFVERYSFASPVAPVTVRFTADMIFGTPLDVMADFLPTFDQHDKRHALVHFQSVETFVLNGAKDILTPPEHSAEIVRLIPGAEHVVIDDAGHIIMLEHPDVLDEQLLALIDRGRRAAADGVDQRDKPQIRRTVTDVSKRRKVARARIGARVARRREAS